MHKAGVFMIHGLGGTALDLGSMHKRLRKAGFDTCSVTLPGHGSRPEHLRTVRAGHWLEAVRSEYRKLRQEYDVLHIMGMCMGALLAVELAKVERHTRGKLVALAAPLFIDGWATPWYRAARHVLYRLPCLATRIRVMEDEPYGIKNERVRAIVRSKLARGEKFHYRWVPLSCIREVDRLRARVRKDLGDIACETLVIHARNDELTSLRSARYLVAQIGEEAQGGLARMVVLENSYHMVCLDNDRDTVTQNVMEFLGPRAGRFSYVPAETEPGTASYCGPYSSLASVVG
ncbi:alpha/beta hydrolase [Burkholderia multivorans]|uniref:alpha/beta hydrolase n=1 Tax=Burkholderia multivorans TaxID=87883 RepID=UPI001C27B2A6|nr:alpha/beta fold hydrolase [Burkholderia multivorans]MBU9336814.1 alpha/beta fold hydrolase [Burkholderia multivorans]MCA8480155.1 alpha/beta fold hydrolase [Burkholderia multivorans]